MQLASPLFDEEEIESLRKCLDSRWVTQGPLVAEFEQLVAKRHQVAHGLATTSCTAALHLSTLALGLGPDDEVIVPAFTWVTSAFCAEYVGARAVFVDVDPDTFNIDPEALEAAITPKSRAIVVVHLFGLAANLDEIVSIARKHDLFVIEDAACAIGTTYKNRPVGGAGDLSCFSFHPRKVITTGEGGMVCTQQPHLAEIVQSYRNHGASGLPSENVEAHGPWTMGKFDVLGFNLRLSDIQAAVGVAQMGKLDGLLAERRGLAANYTELLRDVEEIAPPIGGDVDGHSFQSYVVRVRSGRRSHRNAVMAHLAAHDIQTRPGTHAVHRLGYFQEKYGIESGAFPNAVMCEDTTITLPVFPGMTAEEQQSVIEILKRGLQQGT